MSASDVVVHWLTRDPYPRPRLLAERTHKRRVNCVAPRGIERTSAGGAVAGVRGCGHDAAGSIPTHRGANGVVRRRKRGRLSDVCTQSWPARALRRCLVVPVWLRPWLIQSHTRTRTHAHTHAHTTLHRNLCVLDVLALPMSRVMTPRGTFRSRNSFGTTSRAC